MVTGTAKGETTPQAVPVPVPVSVPVSVSFLDFYSRVKDRPPVHRLPINILALDPGETSGVAQMIREGDDSLTISQFQKNTSIIEWGVDAFDSLISFYTPSFVIIEDYRIYSWRTKEHTWASLHTPRLIGVVECLCRLKRIPLIKQSAQVGKAFVTDARLKEWNLYKVANPHSNDATRHLLQFLLFGEFTK